jgi:hypothetical protein
MVTDILLAGAIQARHNWGRWIVDCGNCSSALMVPPGTPRMTCWDCLSPIGPIVWPADPDGIELILGYRPDPNTRSWEPGETLEDLLRENTEHGLIPDEWLALAQAQPDGRLELLGTTGGVITGGLLLEALPAGRPRPAIGA